METGSELRTVGGGMGDRVVPENIGPYRVLKVLGAGGMGTVYQVYNPKEDRIEALKIPHLTGPELDAATRKRFLIEAEASFDHPNLPKVYERGEENGVCYFTMRYLDGRPLVDYLRKPRPVAMTVKIAAKMAQALSHAHSCQVVHRDLKPANIMLCQGVGPVVMDFGLVKRTAVMDGLTQTGAMMGTPSYMSPEQVRCEKEVGPATDIYSLGVILYELLTNRVPFGGGSVGEVCAKILYEPPPSPSAIRPEVGRALDAICAQAMAKEADQRYRTMGEFAFDLISELRRLVPESDELSVPHERLSESDEGPALRTPPRQVFGVETVLPNAVEVELPTPRAVNVTVKEPGERRRPVEEPDAPLALPGQKGRRWLNLAWAGVGLLYLVVFLVIAFLVVLKKKWW